MQDILVLLGPTAVGKTAMVTTIASSFKAIIYADTASFYRNLNIASAKPSPAEQQLIPHYLIDLLDIDEQFDAARFVNLADQTINTLSSDQRALILSGGSLFYLKSFLFGLSLTPPSNPVSRLAIAKELKEKGDELLYEHLKTIDPQSAARINVRDHYRLCRALEVYRDSGRPLSSFKVERKLRECYNFKIVILERPREELYQRIDQRVDEMVENGLADEIDYLKVIGATSQMAAMRAIGYAEWFNPLYRTTNEIKEAIKLNSRHYAKRQLTFLRLLSPYATTIRADDHDALYKIAGFV